VSLHPNCKKHLKKVPRLTQNTTCKHEFREHSGNIQGTFRKKGNICSSAAPRRAQLQSVVTWRKYSGNIQGTFREHSGNIQGTFREHSGNIQGTLREHSGNIQGTFREHSRNIQGELSGRP
jgi:hypothetical protein